MIHQRISVLGTEKRKVERESVSLTSCWYHHCGNAHASFVTSLVVSSFVELWRSCARLLLRVEPEWTRFRWRRRRCCVRGCGRDRRGWRRWGSRHWTLWRYFLLMLANTRDRLMWSDRHRQRSLDLFAMMMTGCTVALMSRSSWPQSGSSRTTPNSRNASTCRQRDQTQWT